MNFRAFVRRFHFWVGLLMGIQIVLWMTSGVVMSWIHITLVRGETNSATIYAPELEARTYVAPGRVIALTPGATDVHLKTFLGRAVYEVKGFDGVVIYSAETGKKLSPIGKADATRIAKADYTGDKEIENIELLNKVPGEYRRGLPVWRADFDDRFHTRIYISPDSGAITARRNDFWRFYDFFWMLHIMDYNERENFNNWLVRVAAGTGLLFALSGLTLLIIRVKGGQLSADWSKLADKKKTRG